MWKIWYRFPKKGDLKCTDLSNDRIEILGIHFSYNKKVQMKNNYITTISSSFVKFTYAYPWGEKYNIQNSSNIKDWHWQILFQSNCQRTAIYIYIYIYIKQNFV